MLFTFHRRLPKPKLAAVYSAVLSLFGFALVAAPMPASASCAYPTFSIFPGDIFPPLLRYGEVNFSFEVCSDQKPSAWRASVTKQQVNSTGKNLGFFIDSVSIKPVNSGNYYKDFDALIQASTCTPRIGWPCKASYSFKVEYRVTLDRFGNPQVYEGNKSSPFGVFLYSTP